MRTLNLLLMCVLIAHVVGCKDNDDSAERDNGLPVSPNQSCDAEPEVMTTSAGVEFVRTPDACFVGLVDWPYEAKYVEINGMRQAYVDEGAPDGEVVLLLHGQPSWSYLYRKMIPVLIEGGYRVIAMDHLGMGRSDKPIHIEDYSFLRHNDRLLQFIESLDLRDINLFVQDWGSVIGLRVAGLNPERFARIAVGNGNLPVVPAGTEIFPPVENPNEVVNIPAPFAAIPDQQVPFFDGCEPLVESEGRTFGDWMTYAMKAASFHPSEVLEAMTWFEMSAEEEAAYDAPFPSRTYMAGARVFPSLINEIPGTTESAWAGLTAFERPFLTLWAANDPGTLGSCASQQRLVNAVPGAAGQPHDRLAEASHFLQDDQGAEIARRLVQFYSDQSDRTPQSRRGMRYCEILLGYQEGGEIRAEVWGTQGVNLCPAESWEALDATSIQSEYGALFVTMNGPRAIVVDTATAELPDAERRMYGDLEMQLLATLIVGADQSSAGPYSELTVERNNTWVFWSGFETYQLIAPDGTSYMMQAMSQIVDPDLTLADLSGLGSRLTLPEGWTFEANRRFTDLALTADGEAVVIQDELKNTYQRVKEGTTNSPPTSPTLPTLTDGTGTPCNSDLDCQGLEASHCLITPQTSFCTVQGCDPGACGSPYVCCHSCNPAAASFLPFEGSACIPEPGTGTLTSQAGCTCN